MNESLFRKSSMDRLKSPEQLNDYIRVANPSVWLILGAIILLLLGVVAWSVFGVVESTLAIGVRAEENRVVCYVSEADISRVKEGMTVRIGETEGTVTQIITTPLQATEEDSYLFHFSGLTAGAFYYEVELEMANLSTGIYQGKIVLENISPITFVVH